MSAPVRVCTCPLCVPPPADDIDALRDALADARATIAELRAQITDLLPPF